MLSRGLYIILKSKVRGLFTRVQICSDASLSVSDVFFKLWKTPKMCHMWYYKGFLSLKVSFRHQKNLLFFIETKLYFPNLVVVGFMSNVLASKVNWQSAAKWKRMFLHFFFFLQSLKSKTLLRHNATGKQKSTWECFSLLTC